MREGGEIQRNAAILLDKNGNVINDVRDYEEMPEDKKNKVVVPDLRTRSTVDLPKVLKFQQMSPENFVNNLFGEEFSELGSKRTFNADLEDVAFTSPFITRDSENNCKFTFGFDWKDILRYEGKFGGIINQYNQSAIVSESKILDFEIMRHRAEETQDNNRLGSQFESIQVSDLEKSETVVESYDTSSGKLAKTSKEDGEREIGSIKELALEFEDEFIRFFSVSDFGASRKTDGKYLYSVNLKMRDGTVLFVENLISRLERLKSILSDYKEFYSDMQRRAVNDTSSYI